MYMGINLKLSWSECVIITRFKKCIFFFFFCWWNEVYLTVSFRRVIQVIVHCDQSSSWVWVSHDCGGKWVLCSLGTLQPVLVPPVCVGSSFDGGCLERGDKWPLACSASPLPFLKMCLPFSALPWCAITSLAATFLHAVFLFPTHCRVR